MSAGGAGADIDWSELEGAYGPATEVPEILAGLSDPELVADAVDDLFSSVIHQGSLYPVSWPAWGFGFAAQTSPSEGSAPLTK